MKKVTTITINKDGTIRHEGATEADCPDGTAAAALNKGMTPAGRLIITMDCNRACKGCANSFNSLMKHAKYLPVGELGSLAGHETIVVTGGEPLLNIAHTEMIVDTLKALCPTSKLYLYTSMWNKFHAEDFHRLMSKMDGLTYTVHADSGYKYMKPEEYEMLKSTARETDVAMFKNMQNFLRSCGADGKSYRLYVDAATQCEVPIQPNVWERVHIVPWMTEQELLKKCPKGVPPYETLYILKEGGV